MTPLREAFEGWWGDYLSSHNYGPGFVDEWIWIAWQAATERATAAAAEVAERWGETHADGVTVNARNAGRKIAAAIRARGTEPTHTASLGRTP